MQACAVLNGRTVALLPMLMMVATDLAQATDWPPMPPPRPVTQRPVIQGPAMQEPASTKVPPPKPQAVSADVLPEDGGACLDALRQLKIDATAETQAKTANPSCRIDNPVRLRALLVPSRANARIAFADQPIVACRFARSYGEWMGEVVAPMVAGRLSSDIATIHTGPGFECRNVNRRATGKLSAHAVGLAIDMDRIVLENGQTMIVGAGANAAHAAAFIAIRRSACGWFTTVLGPGSDPQHAGHIHVDLQQHGKSGRYRICD
jgi:hypothetical protein